MAIVFIIVLVASTIYSRGFAERQKPLVQLTAFESRVVTWVYESHGTVELADEEFQDRFEWMLVDVIVPREAYIYDMDDFMMVRGWPVEFKLDSVGYNWSGTIVMRGETDGDINLTIGFNRMRVDPALGEGARVFLEFELHPSTTQFLLPDYAIHVDPFTKELYIYLVSRQDGIWGREFVVTRQNVQLGIPGRIGFMTNIFFIGSEYAGLPIVVSSDKPLYDGAVVRLFG